MGHKASKYMLSSELSSQESQENDYDGVFNFYLSDDILIEILSFVSSSDLLINCCLVCSRWRDLIAGHGIWKRKCVREGKVIPHFVFSTIPKHYYRLIYLRNPYGRNLLKNPCGDEAVGGEKFQYWSITSAGGDQWEIEDPPAGADPVPDDVGSQSCFVTSYYDCVKHQRIDLIKEGVSPEIIDELKPKIVVGEWYAARFDCGCIYQLKVILEDANYVKLDSFEFPYTEPQWTGREWHKVTHTFKNYPSGVRYIFFEHSGRDTQFWAGHYGSKMTGGFVKFDFT